MAGWNKKTMSEWYDKHAKDEGVTDDQLVSVPSGRYKCIARDIEQLICSMSFSDEDRVLDAGCGAGRFIYRIRKNTSCEVFGIDTSVTMIKRARKRTPDASYVRADVLHLPFRNRAFTAIVCYSVLWHIPSEKGGLFFNSDIYEKGLQGFKKVLEVEGRVLFNISNPFHLQSIIGFLTSIIKVNFLRKNGLLTYKIPLIIAKDILTKLRFKISDIMPSGYYPVTLETLYLPFHSSPSEKMINGYCNFFRRLEKSFKGKALSTFAYTFVIKAINK
jgi:SAM-dependent methyltransferase